MFLIYHVYRPIAAGAFIATGIACLLLLIQILLDNDPSTPVEHTSTDFNTFFVAFGTILFAFGGHAVFPTIQHDMRKPEDFPRTVFLSYAGMSSQKSEEWSLRRVQVLHAILIAFGSQYILNQKHRFYEILIGPIGCKIYIM